ncbi:MAG TPA: flagellar basal-body rod protein FlgG [Gemmatimonadaceae bacterium]|nr:flagellar basal-body rod protein FlgG [Gemmatimonadaceae bacterium]
MTTPAMHTAATGMVTQETRTEVIANNLANVDTTGFKRSIPHFEDLLYQSLQAPSVLAGSDTDTAPAIQVGRGTRLASTQRIDTQGPLQETDRDLDVAISGDGYFQVQLGSGSTAYTRDGSLQISDQGTLVTSDGLQIIPGIKIPSDVTSLNISATGIVSGTKGQAGTTVELGRIELARFPNPSGLQSLGQNLLVETPTSGQPTVGYPQDEGLGQLVSGQLEGSNVQIVQEMVDMISAQRAYELNSKAVKTADEMAQTATQMVQ